MAVARMWESRLLPGAAEGFLAHLAAVAWPAFAAAPGFAGGEVYRSAEASGVRAAPGGPAGADQADRAVVVTRWADAAAAAAGEEVERGLAPFCAREPHAWVFAQVELAPAGSGMPPAPPPGPPPGPVA